MTSRNKSFLIATLATAAAALGLVGTGCADVETTPGGAGGFISDSPFGGGDKNGGEDSGAGGGGGDTSTSTGTGATDGGEKAIIEADIVQVSGDRLFALSQYGGLSVVNMANPDQLALLGNYAIQGMPFEMYLQGDVIYAMFSSFGRWECDADYEVCNYVSSSHIEALDVSDPAHITQIGTFDLPGEISDSRIVGDVLYAVSYENGYCWNCAESPQTVVTSIAVGNPDDIAVVDSVSFSSEDPYGYGWWRRSVTVTQDRMFVAGIEWDGNGEGQSTIQVVDITDPSGLLHVGAAVQAAGQIESRWQMDEKDGVLRVVSQPGIWWSNGVPQVQTFQIQSSDTVTPLATLNMTLPKPERLRSARFDGDRLFAITAEQTDPLFTIDLTDPAQPAQIGQLEIPGWIYHLEPRGDRLFALGFDATNPEGSMNVSLFDVSDLTAPALLTRVSFGGDWSWAPEDQDRIHKAFKIDTDLGAIFVPFGAYDYSDDVYGCGRVESGIQIVDFSQDALTKRGMAPMHGFARRALVHEGTLFTVSDSEVASYDIADRDAPANRDALNLSAWVNQSVRAGDNVVRVSADWWTNAARLDVVPASDPTRIEPLGMLDLTEVVGEEDSGSCYGWGYFYGAQIFPLGADRVALAWTSYDWYGEGSGASPDHKTHVVVVNVSDPTAPAVEGRLALPFATDMWGWWGSLDGGKSIVQIGNKLVFRHVVHPAYDSDELEQATLEVVSLADPANPVQSASIALPDGFGHSLLVANGNQLLTSHWEPVADMPGKVRFYLDRVAFSAGGQPSVAPPVNVPGALLSFDPASGHVLTIDFHTLSVNGLTSDECYQEYGWGAWYTYNGPIGVCNYMKQSLELIDLLGGDQVELLDSETLPSDFYAYATQVTGTRVFAQGYRYSSMDGYGQYGVLVIGDIGADTIQSTMKDLPMNEYLWSVAADDDRLVLASYNTPGIHVLDATNLDDITIEKKGDVTSYVYAVTLDGDRALCSMGPYGLAVVDLQ